jgi:uncharacterized membrane protein
LVLIKNRRAVFALAQKSATSASTIAKVASNPAGILDASVRRNWGGVNSVFICVYPANVKLFSPAQQPQRIADDN